MVSGSTNKSEDLEFVPLVAVWAGQCGLGHRIWEDDLGGGQGPVCSPCVDQFGQTVSARVALSLGAGLPEHLLLPACPDGSDLQCLQQWVFWEPQKRGRCPERTWEGQITFHPNSPLHKALASHCSGTMTHPNGQRKPRFWWAK